MMAHKPTHDNYTLSGDRVQSVKLEKYKNKQKSFVISHLVNIKQDPFKFL